MTKYPHKNTEPLERLVYWVSEREKIRLLKEAGKPQPWTKDPILSKYRFCNANRENDRVTKWIALNWRRNAHVDHCWHAMIIARFINWPDTLEYCRYPEPWPTKGERFIAKLKALESAGARIFTGAYIVSTNGATGSKVDHVIKLFDRAWQELYPFRPTTLQEGYDTLRSVNGIGSFMAAQVLADLKYTPLLRKAKDWMDFVAPGPGSQRGLNRILGYGLPSQWNNKNFTAALIQLRQDAAKLLPEIAQFHLQDVQSLLCEFDKYERVLHGQGKPRSQYRRSTLPLPGV